MAVSYIAATAGCPGPSSLTTDHPPPDDAPRLASDLAGPAGRGRAGDLLLERDDLRIVVASKPSEGGRRDDLGAIVDAVVGAWADDELRDLTPVVFGPHGALAADVTAVDPTEVEGRPAVRVRQAVATPKLDVDTVVHLVDGATVALDSTLRAASPLTGIRIGDRLRFHGPHAFAPGTGFLDPGRDTYRAAWLAQRGRAVSYAWTRSGGDTDLQVRFDEGAPTEIFALDAPRAVRPDAPLRFRRFFVLERGDLDAVASAAWKLAGTPTGLATGAVAGADERASVTAFVAERPTLTTRLRRDGSFALPLPYGSYRLVLDAPGGTDETSLVVGEARATLGGALFAPKPGALRVSITDGGGNPLPARVIVRGVPPTTDPDFGADELARGHANVAFAATGVIDLALPAGRYDVGLSHGPEYATAHQTLEITQERGGTVRARLDRVVDARDWVGCDLHLHASPSFDSRVPLLDRVTALVAEGVRFAAATDHNHVTDYAPAIESLGVSQSIASTPGVEITTRDWGHFNAYPYPATELPPPHVDVAPGEIFAHVRRVAPGSLIQVNHPRMGDIGYFNRADFDARTGVAKRADMSLEFDTLELFNGFDLNGVPKVEALLDEWFLLLQSGRRYVGVGSSDSHKIAFQWAGYPRTYVWVDGAGASIPEAHAVVAALRAGHAFVTNGPFVELTVEGQRPGATVTPREGKVAIAVEVRAPPWIDVEQIELVVGGKRRPVEARRGEGALRLRYEEKLSVTEDVWILAIVRGTQPLDDVLPGASAPPFAFTNPVFVKVSGSSAPPTRHPPAP